MIDSFYDDYYAEDEDSDGFLCYEDETSCDEDEDRSDEDEDRSDEDEDRSDEDENSSNQIDEESLCDLHSVTDEPSDEEGDTEEDETEQSEPDDEISYNADDLTAAINKFKETDKRRLARIHLLEMRNMRLRAALIRTKEKLNAVTKEKREWDRNSLKPLNK